MVKEGNGLIMESASVIFNLQPVKLCVEETTQRGARKNNTALFHSVNNKVRVIKAREYKFR